MNHDSRKTPTAQRIRSLRRLAIFAVSFISSLLFGAYFVIFEAIFIAFLPAHIGRRYLGLAGSLAILLLWVLGTAWYRRRKQIIYRENPAMRAAFLLGYAAAALAYTFALR